MAQSHKEITLGADGIQRRHLEVAGLVQGVGFRPFVYRLATGLGLCGWVRNSPEGVQIDIEGEPLAVASFLSRLDGELPSVARITSREVRSLPVAGYSRFEVCPSAQGGETTAMVLPDLATCPECLREVLDPGNRRYGYPFTNCTNCGPRFSIIQSLPYDRDRTTMRGFSMCAECEAEYNDPGNRRFHAQPNLSLIHI